MIQVKLTTTNGETKTIPFYNKQAVENFIGFFPAKLPLGVAVCIDAPLIGIHNGWIVGKGLDVGVESMSGVVVK
jgi:hypothetical protein